MTLERNFSPSRSGVRSGVPEKELAQEWALESKLLPGEEGAGSF